VSEGDKIEKLAHMIYDSIFKDNPSVEIDGDVYPIEKTSKNNIRQVKYGGLTFIEQNPFDSSSWAKEVQEGHQIMWVMRGRDFLARIRDGKFLDLKRSWFSFVRNEYKVLLVFGLIFLLGGGNQIGIIPIPPESYMFGVFAENIGILLIIVAVGSLLVKQDMDRKASSLHFYGILLIGSGPAFLIYSQIARYGFSLFSYRPPFYQIYAKTSNWWIFLSIGVVFIAVGVILVVWSWRYRRSQHT
jgi:hypothetical protein